MNLALHILVVLIITTLLSLALDNDHKIELRRRGPYLTAHQSFWSVFIVIFFLISIMYGVVITSVTN